MQPSTRIAKVLDKPTGTRITHGTVEDVQGDKVSVLVDNAAAPETLNRACVCSMGDRVIVVGNDAVATVGAYGGGGGGSIAPTSSMLKGDGSGNAIAATPGTDYMAPVTLAPVATSGDYNDLDNLPTIPAAGLPTGGASGQYLTKSSNTDYDVGWTTGGGGGLSYADFVAEQVTVINGASVANNGYSENTVTATKAGYYPLGVVGWTSNNRYPNVYGCRLTAQSVGSASVFCGASNFTGSTRTLTVTATVLWVKVS